MRQRFHARTNPRAGIRRSAVTSVATSALVLAAFAAPSIAGAGTSVPPTSPTQTSPTTDSTESAGSASPSADGLAIVAGQPMPDERCAANRDAGTITYLTGFDYAAAASMVDVFMAQSKGYYEDLCLDVKITPSFSTANLPIVAAGDAQFSSGGSFSEVLNFSAANHADLVAVVVEGRAPIDVLILKPGTAATLADLDGVTLGVKGALPSSIAAMLATADLREGDGYDSVLLDGYDPTAQITLDGIVGFPGYRSNEPGILERAEIPFDVFDPVDYDVPGSFGIIYTSQSFIDAHPTAAQDFVRAPLHGLADALADPQAAADVAVGLINAGENLSYLTPEGERFRWATDAATITASYPADAAFGVPDLTLLQAEVDAYEAIGVFDGTELPDDIGSAAAVDLTAGVYDDAQQVIWPS